MEINSHFSLPLEILVAIGFVSPGTWRSMLAIPDFARWTMTSHARELRKKFLEIQITSEKTAYYLQGKYHNFNDLPAIIWASGTKNWYQKGLPHRDNDLPAVIYEDNSQFWYQAGLLHRDNDKPAIIHPNVSK